MKRWLKHWALAVLVFPVCIYAAGDIAAGQAKSATCAACHGADGRAPTDAFPNLAGQHALYTKRQLEAFKLGEKGPRNNPVMLGMVAALSPQDMEDLAAYFESQKPAAGNASGKDVEKAFKLYMGGDISRKIPACSACHGPEGEGNRDAGFPALAGQHAAYTVAQLKAFKTGTRRSQMMEDIASRLSDDDMTMLADMIQGLH